VTPTALGVIGYRSFPAFVMRKFRVRLRDGSSDAGIRPRSASPRGKLLAIPALAFVFAVIFVWPNISLSQQEASVTDLLEKAVARSKWTDEQIWNRTGRLRFTFYQLIENLDDDGETKDRDERRLVVFPIDGMPYARLVEINGRQLTPEEQEQENRREEEFRRDSERKAKQRPEPDEEDRLVFDEILEKYRFRMEGMEQIEGRSTHVLSFEPRDRDLPKKRRLDAFLNRTRGTIWIDQELHEVRKIEFSVSEKIKLWWGIAGSFSTIEGTLERRPIEGEDLWAPSRFKVYLKGRAGFAPLHRTQVMEWRDYETIQEEAANPPWTRPMSSE
jgi:hypothetical protein